jgi:hypothetical protein
MSDKVLTYLQGDSQGARRDLIAHCYYDAAQGDPRSGPVVFAVLLDACAEQFAKTPQELLGVVTEFRKLLAEGREMEARIRERVELSNYGVVAEFKDEAVRTKEALRDAVIQADRTKYQAEQMAKEMNPVVATVSRLAQDLPGLSDALKLNHETAQKIAEGTENIKTSQRDIHDLVKHLTKEARINWMTIGFLAGAIFAGLAQELPSWAKFILVSLGVGLLQWLSRRSWNFVKNQTEKLLSLAKN